MTTMLPSWRAALACGALVLASGLAPRAAWAVDVGYVASLVGAAEVESGRAREELSFLDLLKDGSRLRLGPGAELRVCHSAAGFIFGVSGPAVVRVSARDLVAESGGAPVRTDERCTAPLISVTQGGSAFRSLQIKPVPIGLRTWLRVVPAAKSTITKATLMSPDETARISEFQSISVSPVVLSSGLVYPFVITFSDGRTLTMKLAASSSVAADVAVITVSP